MLQLVRVLSLASLPGNLGVSGRGVCLRALLALALFCGVAAARAFSLRADLVAAYYDRPGSVQAREYVPFLDGHKAVHQMMTDESFECDKPDGTCTDLKKIGITRGAVMDGVRWNDFPAVWLDRQSMPWCTGRTLRVTNNDDISCIVGSLVRAVKNSDKFEKDRKWAFERPISMRGHFGDLQFWHSMAPAGQPAKVTYERIRMRMEFAYRASLGEFDLKSDMHAVPVAGLNRLFLRGSRRVGDLLDYNYNNHKLLTQGIALGQMLHIAQDSFARCHVERDVHGRVLRFLSYGKQDRKTHSHFDEDDKEVAAAKSGKLNPIDFGRRLLRLRASDAKWEDVEPLVIEYFEPKDGSAQATAGKHCLNGSGT
ncbi:MAG: hypothetical protein AB7U92_01010 [Piscinibacter sp.]|uniref:hypothetical protein n=1 Tax=Piscinibacter sp. TaxID=1903157 RepID=UPI003D0C1912